MNPVLPAALPAKRSVPVCVLSGVLVAAFFMPWFQILGVGVNGLQLARLGSYGNLAWLGPVLGAATVIMSLAAAHVNNRPLGMLTALCTLGLAAYCLMRLSQEAGGNAGQMLGEVMAIGLYLTLGSAAALFIAAAIPFAPAPPPAPAPSA